MLFHLVHHELWLGWDDGAVGGGSTRRMGVGKDNSAGTRACSSLCFGPEQADGENTIPREKYYLGKVRSNILVSGCREQCRHRLGGEGSDQAAD